MASPRRLERRNCLIVGGTTGIGLASARRFLREGARLVVSGLGESDVSSAARELEPLGLAAALAADVRDETQVERFFLAAKEALGGRLDVLLHVAGGSSRSLGDGALHECSNAGWSNAIDLNVRGVFLTNRLAVRLMLTQELDDHGLRGTIVNVGSALDESPAPEHFATIGYAASKGGVRSLTLSAAAFYAPMRIRFQLLRPGLIATPMSRRARENPAIAEYVKERQPMRGGPGTPEDVAEAALFLAEPASRFSTAVALNVDGGWSVS